MTLASDSATTTGDGPVGIGGWLLPLSAAIALGGAVAFVAFADAMFGLAGSIAVREAPAPSRLATIVAKILVFAGAVASLVLMIRRRPAFVPVAIAFFALLFVSSLVDLWAGMEAQPASGDLVLPIAFVALAALVSETAFLYLRRSRRVRNTFLLSAESPAGSAAAMKSPLADKHP